MSLLLPSKHPSCPTHRTTEKTNKNPVRSFFDKQLCCYQCTTWATKEELPHKRTGRSPPQMSTNLKSPPTLPRRRKLVHHFLYNSQQASSSLHAHTHTHTSTFRPPLGIGYTSTDRRAPLPTDTPFEQIKDSALWHHAASEGSQPSG